jgi:hypothetical protein
MNIAKIKVTLQSVTLRKKLLFGDVLLYVAVACSALATVAAGCFVIWDIARRVEKPFGQVTAAVPVDFKFSGDLQGCKAFRVTSDPQDLVVVLCPTGAGKLLSQ